MANIKYYKVWLNSLVLQADAIQQMFDLYL